MGGEDGRGAEAGSRSDGSKHYDIECCGVRDMARLRDPKAWICVDVDGKWRLNLSQLGLSRSRAGRRLEIIREIS